MTRIIHPRSWCVSISAGDRLQRRGRPRGSKQTAWCCSFNRKLSKRRWASHCSRTHSACTIPPCTPCRTCSHGQKTIRWPPSPLWLLWCERMCENVAGKTVRERDTEGHYQSMNRPEGKFLLFIPESISHTNILLIKKWCLLSPHILIDAILHHLLIVTSNMEGSACRLRQRSHQPTPMKHVQTHSFKGCHCNVLFQIEASLQLLSWTSKVYWVISCLTPSFHSPFSCRSKREEGTDP